MNMKNRFYAVAVFAMTSLSFAGQDDNVSLEDAQAKTAPIAIPKPRNGHNDLSNAQPSSKGSDMYLEWPGSNSPVYYISLIEGIEANPNFTFDCP